MPPSARSSSCSRLGVINLVRTDSQARSRSNKLMRLRVLVQFIAIIILVLLGFVAGAFRQ